MTDYVDVSRDGGVLTIRLNRPDKKNAIDGAMYRAMVAALADAGTDDAISVVLIVANGPDFCSGNDVGAFLNEPEAVSREAFAFVRAIAMFDKPLVAAVQGLAIGVGATMLLHCDLVYLAPDASLGMTFARLGLVPEAGASLLVPAAIGHAKAAAMLLLGEPVRAEDALGWGLATAIMPAGALQDHARARAAALAALPTQAVRESRRLLKGDLAPLMARIDEEARLFAGRLQSDETRAIFQGFLARKG